MRPTRLDIDVTALNHNIAVVKKHAPLAAIVAMVKGNAYGHGVSIVCPAMSDNVDAFGVGFIDEALTIYSLRLSKPIVMMEGFFSRDELIESSQKGFQLAIHNKVQLAYLNEATLNKPVTIWLKYDSGMHRLGFDDEAFIETLKQLEHSSNVKEIILFSHLSCAAQKGSVETNLQLERFKKISKSFSYKKSLANSAALMSIADSQYDIVRPGIMLYGGAAMGDRSAIELNLKPVMHFTAGVMSIKVLKEGDAVGYGAHWKAPGKKIIATISCGYGDGYPRMMHPDAHVLIRGVKCPIIGQVSMEMLTIDVTHLPQVAIGDEVTLWGSGLPCHEVARWVNTIDYDLMTRASLRIKPQKVTL